MINLKFLDIKNNREYNKKVKKLYNSAFPKEERIPILLLKLLARKNKAKFYGIYDNKKFVGLVYNVYYKDIIFIYYLAIDKESRGQGYGSKVLEFIKQKYNKHRIVLSIEQLDKNSNNYKQRIKRKNFYIKNGFKEANYTIKERDIIYEMLYYNENDKKVTLQEYKELIKDYFGRILYRYFYKRISEWQVLKDYKIKSIVAVGLHSEIILGDEFVFYYVKIKFLIFIRVLSKFT